MKKTPIKFIDYLVKELHINTSNEFFNHMDENNEINIDPDFFVEIVRINSIDSLIVLNFELNNEDNKKPFSISTSIIGKFELSNETIDEDSYIEILKHNGVAILFPYLRSLISDVTMKINVASPLILPTMNIVELLKNQNRIKVSKLED